MRIRSTNRIKAIQLKKLSPGKLNDGGGLLLLTKPNGTSFWNFRWRSDGKDKSLGLGSLHMVSLLEARAKAAVCREAVAAGEDPKEVLLAELIVDTDGPTFKQVALDYIALNEAGWKSDEHTHQWKSTLERYVYPRIGNTPIKDVTKHHVRELLLLIWLKKNPTARKVRGRIELVFDYAMGHDLYVGMNPALWRGNLKAVLPEAKDVHKEVHHKSLDYHELPKLVGFLQDRIKSTRSPNSAKALIWTILSGSRYSEVAEATFDEIDLRRNVWVIPAKRMKNGKEHRVPLTPPMVTLFAQLSHERVCDFLFPGIARNDMIFQAMSENTMTKYLQSHTQGNPTVHGMRSTFKSWVLENTKYPDFLSEEQLSHTVGDSVRQAYAHTDLLDMRREMMERWAAFVMGQRQGKVVSIN